MRGQDGEQYAANCAQRLREYESIAARPVEKRRLLSADRIALFLVLHAAVMGYFLFKEHRALQRTREEKKRLEESVVKTLDDWSKPKSPSLPFSRYRRSINDSTIPFNPTLADATRYFPEDTGVVIYVNVKQLHGASLLAQHLDDYMQKFTRWLPEEAQENMLRRFGADYAKNMERMVFSFPVPGQEDQLLIVFQARFNNPLLFEEMASNTMQAHEVTDDRGDRHKVYERKGMGQPVFLAVLDRAEMLLSPNKEVLATALGRHRAESRLPMKHQEMEALLQELDPKHSLAMVAIGKALAEDEESQREFGDTESLVGSIDVNEDVRLELVFTTKDAESARKTAETITTFVEDLILPKEISDGIHVTTKERSVSMNCRLTADDTGRLLDWIVEELSVAL